MRQIGSLPQRNDAVRFASYLVTKGIKAHAEESRDAWAIWVRDEDHLEDAKAALAEFAADPANPRYRDVENSADARLREETAKRESAKQNVVEMRNRWGGRGSPRQRPLTIAVVLVGSALGVMSGMGQDWDNTLLRKLLFADPKTNIGDTPRDKLADIARGDWWRVVTPAFLHFGALHLAFNMVMFYQVGSVIEHRRKSWRLALLILATAVPSNLAQALVPNEWGGSIHFAGLSGVVYGLIGYAWMKSRFQPALGIYINRGTVVLAMIYLILGFLGVLDVGNVRMANWAHGVGFLSGMLIGMAGGRRNER
jgi:GlpG protein